MSAVPIATPASELDNKSPLDKKTFNKGDEAQVSVRNIDESELPAYARGNLTVLDRKKLLINNELNEMGMARYQICLWCLCGFGFFVDLLMAQLLGLTAAPIQREFNVADGDIGNLFVAVNAGLTVGALFFGIISDVFGRRLAFNASIGITGLFFLLSAAPSSFNGICVLVAFGGFGLGGNIPIDTAIALEFLPKNRRFLLTALSLFQPLGVTVCTILAYALIPPSICDPTGPCNKSNNFGWRTLTLVLGGITLALFFIRFFVFNFRESPAYLLNCGRDQDAIDVVHSIAKFNKQTCSLTIEDFHQIEATEREASSDGSADSEQPLAEHSYGQSVAQPLPPATRIEALQVVRNYKKLFSSRILAQTTIIFMITYIFDYFAFNIGGSYLPLILLTDKTIRQTYASYCAIYTPYVHRATNTSDARRGIAAAILSAGLVQNKWLGRKFSMVGTSALQGAAFMAYAGVATYAGSIGLNCFEYFMQTMFNAILYASIVEWAPAQVRTTLAGSCSTLGRLSGIVAPYIAGRLYAPGTLQAAQNVVYLAGAASFVCSVALLFLPGDVRNRQSL